MGFWKTLDQIWPETRHQRCWVDKIGKVLNAFPKSIALAVKSDLHDIAHAETRADALAAMGIFGEKYGAKYPEAVACLSKDRDVLMAFHDYPAEHWDYRRTSNPIECVFATVLRRTVRTKGALSQKTARLMVVTLIHTAAKSWRYLNGRTQSPKVIEGIKFRNGIEVNDATETNAA